tara:strand:- start:1610 stop:2548 length:939 start_codon:yes stop_codon:yes gene_type:complete
MAQGPKYNAVDVPNSSPIDAASFNGILDTFSDSPLVWNDYLRLANHSKYRNPSTGVWDPTRPSNLGDCRGQSLWGDANAVLNSYDYELGSNNTGTGIGLWPQTDDDLQLVFCSTNTPTTQSHFTSSARTTTSSWTSIVNSSTSGGYPSCYVYGRAGLNTSGTQHPLYIYFNGANTGFSLAVVNIRLYYPINTAAGRHGIHEYQFVQASAGQYTSSSPNNTLSAPTSSVGGFDWAYSSIYFAAGYTGNSISSINNNFPAGHQFTTYFGGSNTPIMGMGRVDMRSSINTIPSVTCSPNGLSGNFTAASFWLGMR